MTPTIALCPDERKTLLDYLRKHPDPHLRLRAHIILLLSDGYTWALITAVLFCSSRTIARWKGRFDEGRVPALLGLPLGAPRRLAAHRADTVVPWVRGSTPPAPSASSAAAGVVRRWRCCWDASTGSGSAARPSAAGGWRRTSSGGGHGRC